MEEEEVQYSRPAPDTPWQRLPGVRPRRAFWVVMLSGVLGFLLGQLTRCF